MDFPNISPVAFQIGFLSVRWYSLAYMFGLLGGWIYAKKLAKKWQNGVGENHVDDFLTYATLGVIFGGRLGYVLFYNLDYYAMNPVQILKIWQGGMSFHGGLLGVVVAFVLFSKLKKISFFALTDIIACVAPMGLFLGRVANFINGELYGRVAKDVPWAVVFPNGGSFPRHPSQLYEAMLEGLALFLILNLTALYPKVREKRGFLSGLFVAFYASFRLFVEQFRQPDLHLGFIFEHITMGQALSIPMLLCGLAIIFYSFHKTSKKNDK